MHWLFLHRRTQIKPRSNYQYLFYGHSFNFEAAAKFVRTEGTVPDKLKKLGVPRNIQTLLLTLRHQSIRILQKQVRNDVENLRELLVDKMTEPQSRFPENRLESTCAAYRCLRLGESSPMAAAGYWKFLPASYNQPNPIGLLAWIKSRKAFIAGLLEQSKLKTRAS